VQEGSWGRALWETVQTVLIALVLALIIRAYVVESFVVQGPSMEPTLQDGEHLLVNKFVLRLHPPQPGDIIVFRPPLPTTRDFIKRVIAVGGQEVELRDGVVYVNGVRQAEPWLGDAWLSHDNYPPTLVPAGEVFVLGDNRRNSEDSRFFGFVPLRSIKGEAVLVWWPPQDIRVIR
jgi:signal peptidase I